MLRAKVTIKGVLIPKRLLKGADEVEMKRENNLIVVRLKIKDDPIFKLGQAPVSCQTPDASENLDRYLY